jgi:hypothetical protein
MKYAYISTQEQIYSYDGTLLGVRVCQVQDSKDGLVDVDGVLFWVECADNIAAENSYYDTADQQIKSKPVRP